MFYMGRGKKKLKLLLSRYLVKIKLVVSRLLSFFQFLVQYAVGEL